MKIMAKEKPLLSGEDRAKLKELGIKVTDAVRMSSVVSPRSRDEPMMMTWLLCSAPWDQYNRERKPGTYMDSFDGDVEAFVARYRLRYPVDAV